MHCIALHSLLALCSAALPLLAAAPAHATSIGMSYADVTAEIECVNEKNDVLVYITSAAPAQASGIAQIFDEAYSPLLDHQGEDDERDEMNALAYEVLATLEQALGAAHVVYPDKLVIEEGAACEASTLQAPLELYNADRSEAILVDGQYSCKGHYEGEMTFAIEKILGGDPLYIHEKSLFPVLSGSRETASGVVKLDLVGRGHTRAHAVDCHITSVTTFVTQ